MVCKCMQTFDLGNLLSEVNKEKSFTAIAKINQIVRKFLKRSDNKIVIKPLGDSLTLEVYADSSFKYDNQQGIVSILCEEGTRNANMVGWKSQKSDRRAWSTLAAETHAMQVGLDRAIGLKTFLNEIGQKVKETCVVTDNLSLQRVILSGRSTQEMRLRREISIIRDLLVTDDITVSFVCTEKMLADDLTKKTSGEKLMGLVINYCVKTIGEKVSNGKFKNPEIPLINEPDENPVNHETVTIQISDSESEKSGKLATPRISTGGLAPRQKLAVMGGKTPIG